MTNPSDERAPAPEHLPASVCPPDPQPDQLGASPGAAFHEQTHQHHSPEPQPGASGEAAGQPGLAEQARGTARQARQVAADTAQQVKGQATDAMRAAMNQGRDLLDQQKGRVASEIRTFSEAARRAADRLEEESDTNLSRYVASAADRIEQLGRRIEEGDPRELLDDVRHMARRRPEVFYGGLFVAGLAAARFLKSTRPEPWRETPPRESRPSADASAGAYVAAPEMHPPVGPEPVVTDAPATVSTPFSAAETGAPSATIDPDLPGQPSTLTAR